MENRRRKKKGIKSGNNGKADWRLSSQWWNNFLFSSDNERIEGVINLIPNWEGRATEKKKMLNVKCVIPPSFFPYIFVVMMMMRRMMIADDDDDDDCR